MMPKWRRLVTAFFILVALAGVFLVMAELPYGTLVLITSFVCFIGFGWPVWDQMLFRK
jgi:hypothetical protein